MQQFMVAKNIPTYRFSLSNVVLTYQSIQNSIKEKYHLSLNFYLEKKFKTLIATMSRRSLTV